MKISPMTRRTSRVIRSSTRQALVRDRAARRRACPRRTAVGSARPAGLGIGQLVVVARVAVDRRADRAELLEALPEAVGELVDGGRLGHAAASSVRAGGAPAGRGRRGPPGRLRVAAIGVSNRPELLRPALDRRLQPEVRLEVGEVQRLALQPGPEVRPQDHVPVRRSPCASRRTGDASSLWRASSRRSGRDGEEADDPLVRRDAGVPAQQDVAEHRRPLDLEQERRAAALVPDAVDRLAVLLRARARSSGTTARARGGIEEVAERPVADPAGLVAPPDPDAHPEPVAAVREAREQLRVLGGAAAEVLARSRAGSRWRPGCGSSRGRPGRASRRAGRGRRRGPRRARRTRPRRWARRSRGGCRRPTRRGRRAGSPPPRGRAGRRATSGPARSRRADAGRAGRARRATRASTRSTGSRGPAARLTRVASGVPRRRRGAAGRRDAAAASRGRVEAGAEVPRRRRRVAVGARRPAAARRRRGRRRRSAAGLGGEEPAQLARIDRGRRGSRRAAARSGPARRAPGGPRPRSRGRSPRPRAAENGRASIRSGGANRPRPGHEVGVAAAARAGLEADVAPRPRAAAAARRRAGSARRRRRPRRRDRPGAPRRAR